MRTGNVVFQIWKLVMCAEILVMCRRFVAMRAGMPVMCAGMPVMRPGMRVMRPESFVMRVAAVARRVRRGASPAPAAEVPVASGLGAPRGARTLASPAHLFYRGAAKRS